jgi:hypothetical protein
MAIERRRAALEDAVNAAKMAATSIGPIVAKKVASAIPAVSIN